MQSCNQNCPEPLSLADRIERMGLALTADELARMLTRRQSHDFQAGKEQAEFRRFHIGAWVRFDPKMVAQWLRKM
jgi:hypothetical protein